MPYSAEISRANPGCILFLIDQSASMEEPLEQGTKAGEVADILNRTLRELIVRCGREEGVRDYFEVGVIRYNGAGATDALEGRLGPSTLNPISHLEAHPIRVENRARKVPDGAGGLVEVQTTFPVWFEPMSDGGTPMHEGLTLAGRTLLDWCDAHPSSFPPVVIHLTDGMPTDGTPEQVERVGEHLRQISTEDGEALLMNIHVSGVAARPALFPDSDADLADDYARMLFRMASVLPETMRKEATSRGYDVNEASRAFMFNTRTEDIVHFFEIGTRPSNLR